MNRARLTQQQIDVLMARAEAGDEDAQRALIWLAEKWLFETMDPVTEGVPARTSALDADPGATDTLRAGCAPSGCGETR